MPSPARSTVSVERTTFSGNGTHPGGTTTRFYDYDDLSRFLPQAMNALHRQQTVQEDGPTQISTADRWAEALHELIPDSKRDNTTRGST